ncbi:MAG: nuclear transport factor 2 family protein [Acidobacteria bacterium]|nr:nuclear transport factor 2 family protein [Acidobacteriota bacterium]
MNIIRRILTGPCGAVVGSFFVLLVFAGFASGQGLQKENEPDSDFLRRLKEVEWPKAYREQNPTLLDEILADDFQLISNDGVWSDKAKELARVRTTRPSYDKFWFEIKRLEVFDNGTAIIAGTGHGSGKDKEGRYTFEYQSSNILIKRDGKWKAVSSHVSGYKRTPADR